MLSYSMKSILPVFTLWAFSLVSGDQFIVTQTGDTGGGTLRQAMFAAEVHAGADTILFAIPDTDIGYDASQGVWAIQPTAELPNLLGDSTFVDGLSQAVFMGNDVNLQGPEIVIDGALAGEVSGLTLAGNHIVVRHLCVSGFKFEQFYVQGDSNTVAGCYIGTDGSGMERLGISWNGISVVGGHYNVIGGETELDRNIISGMTNLAVGLSYSSNNRILGNYIGLTAMGTDTLQNDQGIAVLSSSTHNQVGPGNIISGNRTHGITIRLEGADQNTVVGNTIGSGPLGTELWGNGGNGVLISSGLRNEIGGASAEWGNLIVANGESGLRLENGSHENVIAYNHIGTGGEGTAPMGNGRIGVNINYNSSRNVIGPGNCIGYNVEHGVLVHADNSIGNQITQNSVYENGGKGIALIMNGNQNLAAPVITDLGSVSGSAVPHSQVEIFSSTDGEGRLYEATVAADASGAFLWTGTPTGPLVTATATDATNNTSEFSRPAYWGRIQVTHTGSSGEGSLRDGIRIAESNVGPDTIYFALLERDAGYDADAGVWKIHDFDLLLSGRETVIDGFSQAAFIGYESNESGPEVAVVAGATEPSTGFTLLGNGNVLQGLSIYGFRSTQVKMEGDSNVVAGCFLGCGVDGETRTHMGFGVFVSGDHNEVGGANAAHRNVIAGGDRHGDGVMCHNGASFNTIQNNYIGVTASGLDTLGFSDGVTCRSGASENRLGPGNVIAGHLRNGINIEGSGVRLNRVVGNLIGTDALGTTALGSGLSGVNVGSGAVKTLIGGTDPEDRNIISGNAGDGINLTRSDSTRIIGNYIGSDISGSLPLPNTWSGVRIYSSADNQIGGTEPGMGNLIAGNGGWGVGLTQTGSTGNWIAGNQIGIAADGETALGNGRIGVSFAMGASDNQVGPDNRVAHHSEDGILVNNNNTQRNRITQNQIFSNGLLGIRISGGANGNMAAPVITALGSVTGTAVPHSTVEIFTGADREGAQFVDAVLADAAGHWQSDATPAGPFITATATDGEGNTSAFSEASHTGPLWVVTTADEGEGSFRLALELAAAKAGPDSIKFNIPLDDAGFDGTVWVIKPQRWLPGVFDLIIDGGSQEMLGNHNPAGPEIMINGSEAGPYTNGLELETAGNVISGLIVSGFDGMGIHIGNEGGGGNVIKGCFIGTTAAGNDTVPNSIGIYVAEGANGNRIGGVDVGEGNVISGNRNAGCHVRSDSNAVMQNIIGLSAEGNAALFNGTSGVQLASGASFNRIGNGLESGRNIISGNAAAGVSIAWGGADSNVVAGNYIGVGRDGSTALANHTGVDIGNGTSHTVISHNVISGNIHNGITLAITDSNVVEGNYLGTNAQGNAAVPNELNGLCIKNNASYNRIGGVESDMGNLISGNLQQGIRIENNETDYNLVLNNRIGTMADGRTALPNGEHGVLIEGKAAENQIGPGNCIAFNGSTGVQVRHFSTWGNRITANQIWGNTVAGIILSDDGNWNAEAPVITGLSPVSGTGRAGALIEIFSDENGQGAVFEDSLRVDASGAFAWAGTPSGPQVTATATDDDGNTSPFSAPFIVTGVEDLSGGAPQSFHLSQNYPNPFNPTTALQFDVKEPCRVKLNVFNARGQLVGSFIDRDFTPGRYRAVIDASEWGSGIYFCRIAMKEYQAIRKLVLLR